MLLGVLLSVLVTCHVMLCKLWRVGAATSPDTPCFPMVYMLLYPTTALLTHSLSLRPPHLVTPLSVCPFTCTLCSCFPCSTCTPRYPCPSHCCQRCSRHPSSRRDTAAATVDARAPLVVAAAAPTLLAAAVHLGLAHSPQLQVRWVCACGCRGCRGWVCVCVSCECEA